MTNNTSDLTVNPACIPPTGLSVTQLETPVGTDAPVGTLIAVIGQDGGSIDDGSWSIASGSKKARLREPASGQQVTVEVGKVYGDDTGPSNVVVELTGGELGETVLSIRVEYTVEEAATPPSPDLTTELPAAKRSIWASSGHGVNDSQMATVLGTDWSKLHVRAENGYGGGLGAPLAHGDYVMMAPGNFDTNRTIDDNGVVFCPEGIGTSGTPGTASGNLPADNVEPIRDSETVHVKRAAGKVNIGGRWIVNGEDNIVFGLVFTGDKASLKLAGIQNRAQRCEFSGWGGTKTTGSAVVRPVRAAGTAATVNSHPMVWYCTFHHPAPWGTRWGDASEPTNSSQLMRMCIRHDNSEPDTVAIGLHVHRCLFHDLPDKPLPQNYNSAQSDPLEMGNNVGQMSVGSTIVNSGGNVSGIKDWTDCQTIVEDCYLDNVHEFQSEDGAAGAIFDNKLGGTILRRIVARNCGAKARFDIRGTPYSVMEDIDAPQLRSAINSLGHTLRRMKVKKVVVYAGNAPANSPLGGVNKQPPPPAGDSSDKTVSMFQQTLLAELTDIATTEGIEIGKKPVDDGTYKNGTKWTVPNLPATDISVTRCSGKISKPNNPVRVSVTEGTPEPPRNLPARSDCGVLAAWDGGPSE